MCPEAAKISDGYRLIVRTFNAFNLLIILCYSCTVGSVNAEDALSPEVQLGRKIYREGSDDSQVNITATLGVTGETVSATAFTCANCHGLEGEGKQEGGLTIPAITSQQIFSGAFSNNEKNDYDDSALVRAVTKGINSQNKALSATMPRYNLTADQSQALLAYLKHLGSIKDVEYGINENEVQLATVLPLTGPLAATGNLLKATLSACIAEINKQGLIYGRKLTLATLDSGNSSTETLAATRQLVSEKKPFALVSGYYPEFTSAIYSALSQEKIPVIAPLTFEPYVSPTPSPTFFYFLPSYADQSRALVDYWLTNYDDGKKLKKTKLAIIHNDNISDLHVAEAIRRQLHEHHLKLLADVVMSPNSNDQISKLLSKKPDGIFFVGNAIELKALNEMLPMMSHPPVLLGLLAMLSADVFNMPDLVLSNMLLASPFNLDSEMTQFAAMLDRYSIGLLKPGLQRTACAAINFAVEGLKRTGKHVTRSKFIDSLGQTTNFPMEITPPLQFNSNNRVGVRGAYLLTFDTKNGGLSAPKPWINIIEDNH
jgi:ABC-type branched-subunit amino acid transport system substrate-binding protein